MDQETREQLRNFFAIMFPENNDGPSWQQESHKLRLWKAFMLSLDSEKPIRGDNIREWIREARPELNENEKVNDICNAWEEWGYAAKRLRDT